MNSVELQKAVAIAQEAIKDIEDEQLRLKTYEIVLNNLLGGKSGAVEKSEKEIVKKDIAKTGPYKLLSSKIGVELDRIEDFFEISDDVDLLFLVKRESTIEEHLLFLLVYLTAKKICFDNKEADSSHIREMMAIKQISNLTNLSTHIKKFPSLINHKTRKKGSIKTAYRITNEGIAKGLRLIKQIILEGKTNNISMDFLGPRIIRKKNTTGLSNAINQLVSEGFFNNPIPSKKVVIELRKRGFFNRRQDVDAYLRKVLLGNSLLREKVDKVWHYVIKK